jgi:hypothetical protein
VAIPSWGSMRNAAFTALSHRLAFFKLMKVRGLLCNWISPALCVAESWTTSAISHWSQSVCIVTTFNTHEIAACVSTSSALDTEAGPTPRATAPGASPRGGNRRSAA